MSHTLFHPNKKIPHSCRNILYFVALKFSGVYVKRLLLGILVLLSCTSTKTDEHLSEKAKELKTLIQRFADVEIKVDMSHLTEKQKQLVLKLVEASKYADNIFWKQTSHDALAFVEELREKNDEEAKLALEYAMIHYGPYDRIEEETRFYGEGDSTRFHGGAFYPKDMSKAEFESYLEMNPNEAESLKNQYSVVVRRGNKFKALPYNRVYAEDIKPLTQKLREAAALAENPSLKAYLTARAMAIETDDYYDSDVKWMQLKDNDIDIVIGPIENYEDGLFNYRTAYEAAVMIKDPIGTKELELFKSHIDQLEQNLPSDKKYHRETAGKGNVLEVVNIVYFGGDFQSGIKTIAASLPNDPKVHNEFGGKKQMYKNMMAAKYQKMVVPIADVLIAPESRKYINETAFTTFVTMHEVSHTLGRGFVYGKPEQKVREALKEHYSPIEEAKADVLGIYNIDYFAKNGTYTDEQLKQFYVTYLAGLFRSIRFGATEAHGKANIAQMVYLKEQGSLSRNNLGYWVVHFDKFHEGIRQLGKKLLHIQAEGSYEEADRFLNTYGKLTSDIQADIEKLNHIPRDLNTRYAIL